MKEFARRSGIAWLVTMLAACSAPEVPTASLVVTGARVWTGDAELPWAEAVAVAGEEILAVGSSGDVAQLIGDDTEVIEADDADADDIVLFPDNVPGLFDVVDVAEDALANGRAKLEKKIARGVKSGAFSEEQQAETDDRNDYCLPADHGAHPPFPIFS